MTTLNAVQDEEQLDLFHVLVGMQKEFRNFER
jgi:hypothetical protein